MKYYNKIPAHHRYKYYYYYNTFTPRMISNITIIYTSVKMTILTYYRKA